jgi:hypothetical protein
MSTFTRRERALEFLCAAAWGLLFCSTPRADESFVFTKQDEVVLESSHAAEVEWDRHGVVYKDDDLSRYIREVAARLLPEEPPARIILFLAQRELKIETGASRILTELRQSLGRIPEKRFVGDSAAPNEWAVTHVHAIGFPCEGWLYVSGETLGYRPLRGNHGWQALFADVAEVADAIGYGFQVKLRDGRNFRFAGKGIERINCSR